MGQIMAGLGSISYCTHKFNIDMRLTSASRRGQPIHDDNTLLWHIQRPDTLPIHRSSSHPDTGPTLTMDMVPWSTPWDWLLSSNRSKCRFLELPTELRFMIYAEGD